MVAARAAAKFRLSANNPASAAINFPLAIANLLTNDLSR
jgi:hypothetical protein